MQYFNQSNSEVEYIKDILHSTYIPTVRIFNADVVTQPQPQSSQMAEGRTTEIVSYGNESDFFDKETIIYNKTIQVAQSLKSGEMFTKNSRYIEPYVFGKWYKNITTNFITNKDYYDFELHERLGRYLRAYRDYYRVDVMNLYNCFSNRFITSYSLPIPLKPDIGNNEIRSLSLPPYNSDYKLTAFPILWDTEYTIKFCSQLVGNVTLQAVYFSGNYPLYAAETETHEVNGYDVESPVTYTQGISNEFTIKIGSRKGNDTDDVVKSRLCKQNLLYLFMQFPAEITSPIIVIEQPKFTFAVNSSLLNVDDSETQQVAFSDTLLEYLTGSAITYETTIGEPIHNIQNIILSNNFYNIYGVGGPDYAGVDVANGYKFPAGVFDDVLHEIIYKAFFKEYIRDSNGKIIQTVYDVNANGETVSYGIGTKEYQEKVNEFIRNGNITPVPDFMGFITKDVEPRILLAK